jgi:hypothetical protein
MHVAPTDGGGRYAQCRAISEGQFGDEEKDVANVHLRMQEMPSLFFNRTPER